MHKEKMAHTWKMLCHSSDHYSSILTLYAQVCTNVVHEHGLGLTLHINVNVIMKFIGTPEALPHAHKRMKPIK
jgi:hypothetical protein